tara:strand:- start:24 stop:653 length:630 start_codon:yes stop_codon:yes gene_type:complete
MKKFISLVYVLSFSLNSFSITTTDQVSERDVELMRYSEIESEDKLRLTRIIVRDEGDSPICYMTSSSWFNSALDSESKIDLSLSGIQECNESQIVEYGGVFNEAIQHTEQAALPAVLGVGIFACSLGGASGAVLQSVDSLLIEGFTPGPSTEIPVYGVPAIVGAQGHKAIKNLKGVKLFGSLTGVGVVSVVCAELAEMGVRFGLDFLFE